MANNGGREEDEIRTKLELYKAAISGDWEKAMGIKPITAVINKRGETALHVATAANHTHFVEKLVDMIANENAEDLAITTKPPIAPQASSLSDAMASAATAFKIAADPTIGPKPTAATLAPATGNANASRQENTEPKAKVTIVDPIQDAAAAPQPQDRAPQSQASSLSDAMASAATAFKIAADPTIGPKPTAATLAPATGNANASRQENTEPKAKVTIVDPIQDAAAAPQPQDRAPQSQASSLSDAMASAPTAFKIAEDPAIGPKATAAAFPSATENANASRQENTKLKAKVTIADPIQDAAAAAAPQPWDRVPQSQASSLSDAMASAPTAFKIAEDPAIGPKATAATLASAIRSANVSRQENTKPKAKVTIADPIQDAAAALQPRDRVPPSQDPATEPEEQGNTAFCYAALSGNVKIAQIMKMKKQDLSVTRGGKNLFPIHIAALAGHAQMVHELYDEDHIKNQLTNDDRISLLIALVESDIYDVALKMIERHPELATMNDHTREEETALHAFARKPCIPSIETSTGIWSCCKNFYLFFSVAGSNKSKHEQGLELVQQLWEKVILQDEEKVSKFMIIPSGRLIFIAAENGNVEFLTILIRQYPALILKVDENKHTIFHKAVLYRHEKIFKLIFELGMMKNLINIYEDENKNNMLHLAGQLPLPSRLNVVPGAALQLQQELLWFEEVKKVVRPGQIVAKNTQKQTAREVFMEKHENLRIAAEKWMIKTANSCMLVATLIATVTFAAAFTLPGGNRQDNGQDNGFPVFLNRTLFKIFAIADAVSLAFSSSSILSFLSILTSPFSMDDFLKSLPNKLIRGFLFLFIAIITMMGAFVLAFFLIFKHGLIRFAISIAALAFIPILLFIGQLRLVFEMIYSTYKSSFLFCCNKKTLFPTKSKFPILEKLCCFCN